MDYIPHHQMDGRPHLMIDGAAMPGTALTLSHWPKSGTPWPLKGDLSAEIVFNYLKQPAFRVDASAATNTHYDTDGLVGIWAALHPAQALEREPLLVEIAKAGDFGCFKDWDGWRVSCALSAYAEGPNSPLPGPVFEGSNADRQGKLYQALLPLLPEMMAAPGRFRPHWEEAEARLKEAEALVRSGQAGLREDQDLQLAVFDLPPGVEPAAFPQEALHNATDCMALLVRSGARSRFYYRYETWVQFVSRPLRPRVDLRPLAARLTELEAGRGEWATPEPEWIVPVLSLAGAEESRIPPALFERMLKEALAAGAPAFDPFDAPGLDRAR